MAVCHAIPSALLRQPWPGVQLFRLCPRNCRREIRLVAASLSCGSPRQTHTAGPPFPTCLHSVCAVSLPAEAVGEQGQHSNSGIASVCFWAVCSAPALSLERLALALVPSAPHSEAAVRCRPGLSLVACRQNQKGDLRKGEGSRHHTDRAQNLDLVHTTSSDSALLASAHHPRMQDSLATLGVPVCAVSHLECRA